MSINTTCKDAWNFKNTYRWIGLGAMKADLRDYPIWVVAFLPLGG